MLNGIAGCQVARARETGVIDGEVQILETRPGAIKESVGRDSGAVEGTYEELGAGQLQAG